MKLSELKIAIDLLLQIDPDARIVLDTIRDGEESQREIQGITVAEYTPQDGGGIILHIA